MSRLDFDFDCNSIFHSNTIINALLLLASSCSIVFCFQKIKRHEKLSQNQSSCDDDDDNNDRNQIGFWRRGKLILFQTPCFWWPKIMIPHTPNPWLYYWLLVLLLLGTLNAWSTRGFLIFFIGFLLLLLFPSHLILNVDIKQSSLFTLIQLHVSHGSTWRSWR